MGHRFNPRQLLLRLGLLAGLLLLSGCGPDFGDMRGYLLISERTVDGDSSFVVTVRLDRNRATLFEEEAVVVTDAAVSINGSELPYLSREGAYQADLHPGADVLTIEIEDHAEAYALTLDLSQRRIELEGFPEEDDDLADGELTLSWPMFVRGGVGYLEVFRTDLNAGELVQGLSPLTYTLPESVRGDSATVYFSYRDDLTPPGAPFEEATYHFTRRASFDVP